MLFVDLVLADLETICSIKPFDLINFTYKRNLLIYIWKNPRFFLFNSELVFLLK